MKVRVKCTVFVEVELPDGTDAEFAIEENSCPGTGPAGAAIDAAMEHGRKAGVCWACNLQGKNEIDAFSPNATPPDAGDRGSRP